MTTEIGLLPTVIEVIRVQDITPRMRRVTFGGDGVAVFASDETRVPNIKLVFPNPETGELALPANAGTNRVTFPDPVVRGLVRTYTVRRLDAGKSELDIDFVKHGDEGLAGGWAENVQVGDRIGVAGGGGNSAPPADWYLIVGDDTALPAIGRMLERLPEGARGVAVIEVADEQEQQNLFSPADIEIRWVHRGDAAAGTTTHLLSAATAVEIPEGDLKRFAWVCAESKTVLAMRRYLRNEVGFDRKATLVIGYWRHGMTETGYGRTTDHDRDFDEHDHHEHHEH